MHRFLASSFQLVASSGPFAFALVFFVGVVLIIFAGFLAVPGMLVALIAVGIHWYNQKPATTQELRAAAEARPHHGFPTEDAMAESLMMRFAEASERLPAQALVVQYVGVVRQLYLAEDLINPLPPLPPGGDIEEGRYRDRMLARTRKMADSEQTLAKFSEIVGNFLLEFTRALPPIAFQSQEQIDTESDTGSLATVPLISLISNVPEIVQSLVLAFAHPQTVEAGLFVDVRRQLNENAATASRGKKEPVFPIDSKLPADELIAAYLANTPFRFLFDTPIPFNVALSKQLEHQMVVGGTRWGKSQLMGALIDQHLNEENPPGLIVIDSQGDFLSKISRLDCFNPETGRLKDRLLIINPEDSAAPALNMFDISALRAKDYKPEDLENVEAEIIHLFSYVFASMATELTSQQSGTFSYLVRLLLAMPGSNIHTLRELLEDKADGYSKANPKFREYIEKLDPTAQDYFKNQYYSKTLLTTRLAIARRLYGVIQVPVFERMFAGANKVDFADAMNAGMVIVVNTSKSMLKEQSSALFGRYIIARVLSGAFERVTIPMEKRRPCIMFVDEAQEYFDDSMDTLLTQIAKFKLGICIAFQYVDQLPNKLRASVIGNTTVKYVGGVTFADARYLAREMRVSEQMVLAQKKDPRDKPEWAQFATFVRNSTSQAVSLTVPFYALESRPQMDASSYDRLLEINRARVSRTEPPPAATSPQTPEPPASAPPAPVVPITDGDDLPTTWGDGTIKP